MLQASRETDCEIAEILGWTAVRPDEDYIIGGKGTGVTPNEKRISLGETHLRTLIPYFSSDIIAAWGVKQYLKEGHNFYATITDVGTHTCVTLCKNVEDRDYTYTAWAETFPLAMCEVIVKIAEEVDEWNRE